MVGTGFGGDDLVSGWVGTQEDRLEEECTGAGVKIFEELCLLLVVGIHFVVLLSGLSTFTNTSATVKVFLETLLISVGSCLEVDFSEEMFGFSVESLISGESESFMGFMSFSCCTTLFSVKSLELLLDFGTGLEVVNMALVFAVFC